MNPAEPPLENPEGQSAAEMSKEDFLRMVGLEIDRIRSETARPGWTPWALWGAFAVLGWTFVQAIEGIDTALLPRVAIAVELIYISLWMLFRVLSPSSQTIAFNPVFVDVRIQLLGTRRGLALAFIIYAAAACYCIAMITVSPFVAIMGFTLFATISLGSVAILVLSYFSLYVPRQTQSWGRGRLLAQQIGILVVLLILPVSLGALILGTLPESMSEALIVIRPALLVWAIIRILFLLANVPSQEPVASALLDIRREVARDRLGVPLALKLYDSIVAGMSAAQLVLDRSGTLVQRIATLGFLIESVRSRLAGLKGSEGEVRSDLPSAVVDSVLMAAWADLEAITTTAQQLSTDRRVLGRLANRVARQSAGDGSVLLIVQRLDDAVAMLSRDISEVDQMYQTIRTELGASGDAGADRKSQ